MQIGFTINGESCQVESDPRTLLLDVLREGLGLRGTKYGCGEGECGACTVLLNGRAVNACLTTVGQAHGGEILTIEAMAQDELGQKVLASFVQSGAVQCGFCTPGFILATRALLTQPAAPDSEQIRRGLGGNLCRCTGYAKIVEAVTQVATQPASASHEFTMPHAVTPLTHSPTFVRPASLNEALNLLATTAAPWRIIAGGTDLLVRYEHRVKELKLLDLSALAALRAIDETSDAIQIGALTTYTELLHSPLLARWAPALVMAAREVGGAQIQNMGTIGGNLVNASPAADSAPPLLALNAQLVLRSMPSERQLPIHEFATGPGRTCLAQDELLTKIIIPKGAGAGRQVTFFEKVGPRKAQTIAKASVAFNGWLQAGRWQQVRIALGAVAPTVMLAPQAAALLMAEDFTENLLWRVAEMAAAECTPIDDLRSTATYRRQLVRGLVIRNLYPYLDADR